MKTQKNNSAKIIIPLVTIGIGMALLLFMIPGKSETAGEQQVNMSAISDGTQPLKSDNSRNQESIITNNKNYHRTFRTKLSDPADNREKIVELHYSKENVLLEVVIGEETIVPGEFSKHSKLIIEALSEDIAIRGETNDLLIGLKDLLKDAGVPDMQNIMDNSNQSPGEKNDNSENEIEETGKSNLGGLQRKLEELESTAKKK
jgi:hypothetical protein